MKVVMISSFLLCYIYMNETASRTRKHVGRGLILFVGNWLDGCDLLLDDLMWVTGCPALKPVYTYNWRRQMNDRLWMTDYLGQSDVTNLIKQQEKYNKRNIYLNKINNTWNCSGTVGLLNSSKKFNNKIKIKILKILYKLNIHWFLLMLQKFSSQEQWVIFSVW